MKVNQLSGGLLFGVLVLYACHRPENKKPNTNTPSTDDRGPLDTAGYAAADLPLPASDRLSNSGIRFTWAQKPGGGCLSRAALFRGRHPQRAGINDWTQNIVHDQEKPINLPPDKVTLAEVAKEKERRDRVVPVLDFYPTICEVSGSNFPASKMKGQRPVPFLSANVASTHQVYFVERGCKGAVIDGKWKLIANGRGTNGEFPFHMPTDEMQLPGKLQVAYPKKKNEALEHPEFIEG